ncbi:MAG TPA: hypothetical protein VMT17_04905 [Anaeromyxobacteraceae bacterium]|nr:hypothetical protein [Anaeromyxobacteraceae bacterium]
MDRRTGSRATGTVGGRVPCRWALVVPLALLGCYHPYIHDDFLRVYRSATLLVIAPPNVTVLQHVGPGVDEVQADWSRWNYGVVVRVLQAEFDARKVPVAWVPDTPEMEWQVARVYESFLPLLPRLGGVPNRQIRRPRRAADSGLELDNPDRVCEAMSSVINTHRATT